MLYANLYVDKIDIRPYLTPEECRGAGASDCAMLAARLKAGLIRPEDCPNLSPGKRYALSLALRAQEVLPPVPSLELPRPVPPTSSSSTSRAPRRRCWSAATANSP